MIRVASYCRVSTDKEDQANSFDSQQRYFREYIERRPDWELYAVYADEGITGTSTLKRVQFNRMMNDAYNGKFKLIITKEVSRFSRNILDTIACTRELKSLGIGVIFMSDGISTLDPDAELRLSIMGSIAQEESRKTSARVKWGQTRQMERGIVFGRSLLGYDVHNGIMTVNPQEAEIVRMIFHKYGAEKMGTTVIARKLQEAGYTTRSGNPVWSNSYILKILKNEKYVGDLVQKKTITPDYLTHARKYNHGEEAMVIIANHHEAIISRELWNMVQEEIRKRRRTNTAAGHSNRYLLSGKIQCAQCGACFVSRVKKRKHGGDIRRWGCFRVSRDGKEKCDVGRQLRDDLATDMLVSAVRSLPMDFSSVISKLSLIAGKSAPSAERPEKIRCQIRQIEEKKTKAVDAHLSGVLSAEDLRQIKLHYDAQLCTLHSRIRNMDAQGLQSAEADLAEIIGGIATCKRISEPFLKLLLEYLIVHKDGRVDLKLNGLATVWHFQLVRQ